MENRSNIIAIQMQIGDVCKKLQNFTYQPEQGIRELSIFKDIIRHQASIIEKEIFLLTRKQVKGHNSGDVPECLDLSTRTREIGTAKDEQYLNQARSIFEEQTLHGEEPTTNSRIYSIENIHQNSNNLHSSHGLMQKIHQDSGTCSNGALETDNNTAKNCAVAIGPNGTTVTKKFLKALKSSLSAPALTRKILVEVFGREMLATHNLTGKPSPAFLDRKMPIKGQLDPNKVSDIIHFVLENKQTTRKEVKNAITTKCADEAKMRRQNKRKTF